MANRNVDNFHYLKHNLSVTKSTDENPLTSHIRVNSQTSSVLDELYRSMSEEEKKKAQKEKEKENEKEKDGVSGEDDDDDEYANFIPEVNAVFSKTTTAPSFTSTSLSRSTTNKAALVDRNVLRYAEVKKKAYVSITTNLGKLNLEVNK